MRLQFITPLGAAAKLLCRSGGKRVSGIVGVARSAWGVERVRIWRLQASLNQDLRRRHVRVRTALAHGGHGESTAGVHGARRISRGAT